MKERGFQVGGLILSICGAAAFPYWIYVLESPADDSIWPWPGLAFVAALILGVALMVPSFRNSKGNSTKEPGPVQSIHGGHNSRNYQAGGDIRIGGQTDDTP